jgi:hypothetical protein
MDRSSRLRPAVSLASSLLLLVSLMPPTAQAATVWRFNLYRSGGFLYQDPYYTACTAAAAMMMLNFTDLNHTGGNGFRWTTYRTKNSPGRSVVRDMTSILWFERAHDTLSSASPGSDAHGWRNALNYYGWGNAAMTDPNQQVYDDRAYGSFDSALKGAVSAVARHHMPVGLLAWGGQHAQVVTGYVASGEDPTISNDFVVNGLFLSDPLRSDLIVNRYINRLSLLEGDVDYRFRRYREADSPFDDPYRAGWLRSSVRTAPSEWYGRWVLVQPIRPGLPSVTPPPDPTPTPNPTPTPDPTPTPTPLPSATAPPDPTPTPTSTAAPDSTPTPDPTQPVQASPSADPSAAPDHTPSPSADPSASSATSASPGPSA